MNSNLPTIYTKDLVREIAMDIGKAVAHHIETMYPKAVEAASSTFLLSVRNSVHNEIIAAIQVNDEGAIIARLRERKKHRRKINRLRKAKTIKEVLEINGE